MHASPDPLGQGEPAKCQKWLPSSAESATGQLPKGGSEASLPGGQNAQLGGHWAGMWEHGPRSARSLSCTNAPRGLMITFCWRSDASVRIAAMLARRPGAVRCGGGSYLFALQVVDRQLEVARSEGVQHSDSLFGVWTHKPSVLASYPQGADKFNLKLQIPRP